MCNELNDLLSSIRAYKTQSDEHTGEINKLVDKFYDTYPELFVGNTCNFYFRTKNISYSIEIKRTLNTGDIKIETKPDGYKYFSTANESEIAKISKEDLLFGMSHALKNKHNQEERDVISLAQKENILYNLLNIK
jgi:hypothetical protein